MARDTGAGGGGKKALRGISINGYIVYERADGRLFQRDGKTPLPNGAKVQRDAKGRPTGIQGPPGVQIEIANGRIYQSKSTAGRTGSANGRPTTTNTPGPASSAKANGGLPKAQTGDSYRTFSGVTIMVKKDGTIILPNGQRLPKGTKIKQPDPRDPATLDLPGSDDFLGFSNGVVVRNKPEGRPSNVSKRQYRQTVELDTTGKMKPGSGFGSRPGAPKAAAPVRPAAPTAPTGTRGTSAPAASAPPGNRSTNAPTPRPAAAPRPTTPAAPAGTGAPRTSTGGGTVGGGTAPRGGGVPMSGGPAPAARPGAPAAPGAAAKPGAPATKKGTDAEVRRMFGDVAAFLAEPEIGPILRKAAAEGWDNSRLMGALTQTRFWKTKGDTERKWIILNRLDNATARRQVEEQASGVWDMARSQGLNLSGLQVHDLAVNALKFGWSSSEIRTQMFNAATKQPGGLDTAVATQYGYLAAFLDNPEVGPLLERAAREGWTEVRLEAELQKTNFWKTTTDSQRRFNAAAEQDPASVEQSVSARTSELLTTAQSLGVTIDPDKLRQIAQDSLRFGWNDAQIRRSITAEFDYQGGESGVAGQSARQIRTRAAEFLVPISDAAMEQWTEKMVRGEIDMEGFDAYLIENAKSLFPGMAGALDRGITVAQYADPYKQTIARELEMNPEDIDFMDPRWRAVLDQKDSKGNRVSMTLSESAEYVRKMPEWQQTRGANERAAALTENILKTFGAVA